MALRLAGKAALDVLGHGEKIHLVVGAKQGIALPRPLGLVELRQHKDVGHQCRQPLRVSVDAPGKFLHVIGLANAVADKLRRARDRRDGCLELVRHVGRELAAHVIGVLDGAHALHQLGVLLV